MSKITAKKSIGIITIATGRYYDEFIPELKKSVDIHLSGPALSVSFYCFTDALQQAPDIHHFPIKHLAWPFSTLMRFHWISMKMKVLEKHDFLLYMDADMKLVSKIPSEIFNFPLIAVQHPGFANSDPPFELDRSESSYVPPPLRKNYYQGCFWGGQKHPFEALINQLSNQVNQDLGNGFIPIWHDESYLNYYLASKNCHVLSPRFAWPQGVSDNGNTPYVLHLDKPHNQIRQVNQQKLDLKTIEDDENIEAQLILYKRLYLTAHEKCQRLELRLAQKNILWLRIKEWISYYKSKNNTKISL